jgi:hypothetical protein
MNITKRQMILQSGVVNLSQCFVAAAKLDGHLINDALGLLGISQSTYQRWEAGTLQMPEKKVTQIGKLFGTSKAAILGTPQQFDLFGMDKSIGDDRTYCGEVAIHFKSGDTPLLLPITEAVHGDLFSRSVRSLSSRASIAAWFSLGVTLFQTSFFRRKPTMTMVRKPTAMRRCWAYSLTMISGAWLRSSTSCLT